MKRTMFYTLGLSLALALCAAPLSPAFAADIEINSSVTRDVYGNSDEDTGANSNGIPTGNSVHLTGGGTVVTGNVAGAFSNTEDANGNTVTLDAGATVTKNVTGGKTGGGTGEASNNTVTIIGQGTVQSDVVGGYSYNGAANGNDVTLDGDITVDKNVFGGNGMTQVSGNTVTIDGANAVVGLSVYGGRGYGANSAVSGNTVIIHDGTVNGSNVAGGWGEQNAVVSGNSVTINGGYIDAEVHGGRGVDSAAVSGNRVEWTGGAITENVYGGSGAVSTGNSVLVNGAGIVHATGKAVIGGYGTVEATGNSVTVQEGTVEDVLGGFSDTATGNRVTVLGGTTDDIYGGYSHSASGSATASGNSVSITGGTTDAVYGGYAKNDSGPATASGNSVLLTGGTVNSDIVGGYASGSGNTAINNTVTISGSPVINSSSNLYGGYVSSAGDAFTGNTLNLHSQISVTDIYSFENLNFYLPTSFAAGDTMLTVTGRAILTENTDSTGRSSVVNVGIDGGASPLLEGDQVVLIDAGTLVTNSDLNTTANGQGMQGVTLRYQFAIEALNNQLLATVTGVGANEQAKALSEGFAGSLALTMQGADLAAGTGMANAVSAAGASGSGSGFGSFGGISGGSLRYNSGSHVDMNSVSLMAGLAWGVDTTPGRLTLGAFFEYGNGSYDTHNSFSNSASVNGDGDTYYTGGGVLGRMDFTPTGPGRFYTEASARMGKAHNEYNSSDLQYNGIDAEYDSSSLYYGFHLGTGYIWNITEAASLDLYGKYFWTRQEGDSVTLSTNDPVTFKDADSSRLRFGGRFAYAVNEYVSPYVGAAYEHEFDGKARATSNGFALDAPSLKGDTGIGEIGLTLKPSATVPLSFDLGLQGYTGKREGVTGSLQVKFEF